MRGRSRRIAVKSKQRMLQEKGRTAMHDVVLAVIAATANIVECRSASQLTYRERVTRLASFDHDAAGC